MSYDIGKLKTRVYKGHHDMFYIQTTHNGSQWQSINLPTLKDVRLLWQDLSRFLGEEDTSSVKHMSERHKESLFKALKVDVDEQGAS